MLYALWMDSYISGEASSTESLCSMLCLLLCVVSSLRCRSLL